jgi:hypothetical protein
MTLQEAKAEVDARVAWSEPRGNILRFLRDKGIPDADAEHLISQATATNQKEESSAISFLYFIPSCLLILILWPLALIYGAAGMHSGASLIERLIIYCMIFCWGIYPIVWILAFSFSLIAYGLDWSPKLFKRLCTLPLFFAIIPYLFIAFCALIRKIIE